jgi:hypothetical protein
MRRERVPRAVKLFRWNERLTVRRLSQARIGVRLPDGREAVAHGEPLVNGFWIFSSQVEWADGSRLREGDREEIIAAFRAASGPSRDWEIVVDDEPDQQGYVPREFSLDMLDDP